jgi:ATP-binding cassette subfamily B protein
MRRGSLTVVTGRIGSGKTTLLRAILGLLPVQAGEIVWNGRVVGAPGEFMVPPRATYTPQIPVLLSGTLRDNIAFGKEPGGDTLDRSIHDAMLRDDVAALAAGPDTPVGVRGTRLSGGQVQRTAAARMFTSAAELYVCDDISSALDMNTERQFWERAWQRKGTWLIVSHSPEVLAMADQIIVLEEGRVASQILEQAVDRRTGNPGSKTLPGP